MPQTTAPLPLASHRTPGKGQGRGNNVSAREGGGGPEYVGGCVFTHSGKQLAGARTQLSDTSAPRQGLDPGTITWASQGQAPGLGAFPHSEG